MYNYWGTLAFPTLVAGWLSVVLIPLMIWSVFWKGWALWKAAKNDSKVWFIVLLVINTVGILDIIYIFLVAKKKSRK
jgi:hypothetical protein